MAAAANTGSDHRGSVIKCGSFCVLARGALRILNGSVTLSRRDQVIYVMIQPA